MPLAPYSSRNYRWFHDFYVCSLGAPISANTWNHRNPSTPLKSSCFATEIMSWMFSLISTPSFSHTRVKFSMQISIFKQLYLFTEALSGKSEHNSDSLKIWRDTGLLLQNQRSNEIFVTKSLRNRSKIVQMSNFWKISKNLDFFFRFFFWFFLNFLNDVCHVSPWYELWTALTFSSVDRFW